MPWHDHPGEDELFWVVEGLLTSQLHDAGGTVSDVVLGPGEIFIVPKGAWHRPIAAEEVRLVLAHPKATTHTGFVRDEMTEEVADQHWI